jgi:hypothetical protein
MGRRRRTLQENPQRPPPLPNTYCSPASLLLSNQIQFCSLSIPQNNRAFVAIDESLSFQISLKVSYGKHKISLKKVLFVVALNKKRQNEKVFLSFVNVKR